MLFSYYGHPVNHTRIVESLYGTPANHPSGRGWNITARVNRTWSDDKNKNLTSQLTSAYDADASVNTVKMSGWSMNSRRRPSVHCRHE
jgi:hypothetical protein